MNPEQERDEHWDSMSEYDRRMYLSYIGLLFPFPLEDNVYKEPQTENNAE